MPPTIPNKNLAVLLVEDEPLIMLHLASVVEELGFEALQAFNAKEAIDILMSRSDIRIVFTDIDMPGTMDGIALAAVVRNRWPPIDIIIGSGHRRPTEIELPARGAFFSKPYDEDALKAALRSMTA